jgi:hypothetical protein
VYITTSEPHLIRLLHKSPISNTNITASHIAEDKSFIIIVSGVRLCPLGTAATTGLLYQPQMIDDGDCGAIGGIKIDRVN